MEPIVLESDNLMIEKLESLGFNPGDEVLIDGDGPRIIMDTFDFKNYDGEVMDLLDIEGKQIIMLDPTKLDAHQRVTKDLHDTWVKKNADYGNSFGKAYKKYGDISALTRIGDKFERIESLLLNGSQQVNDESFDDTILDMANYLIMWSMERRKLKR